MYRAPLRTLVLAALPVMLAACASSNTYTGSNWEKTANISFEQPLTVSGVPGQPIRLFFDGSVTEEHRARMVARVQRAVEAVTATFHPAGEGVYPLDIVFTNGRQMTKDDRTINTVIVPAHVEEPLAEFMVIQSVFRQRVNPEMFNPTDKELSIADQFSIMAAWAGVHLMSTDLRRQELVSRLYLDHAALADDDVTTSPYISHVPVPHSFQAGQHGGFTEENMNAGRKTAAYQRHILAPMIALAMDAMMRPLAKNPKAEPNMLTLYNDVLKNKTDLMAAFEKRVKGKTDRKMLRGWLAGQKIQEGYVFRGLNRNDEKILPTLPKPVLVKGPVGEAEVFLWKENPKAPNKKRVFLVTHKTFSRMLVLPHRMDRYYRRLLVELLPYGDVLVVHRPNIGKAKGAYESYGGCKAPDYEAAASVAGSYVMAASNYLQSLGYNHIVALGTAAGGIAVVDGARNGTIEQVFTFNAGRGIQSDDKRCDDTSSMDVMIALREQVHVPVIHIASNQDLRYVTQRRREMLEDSGDETLWYDVPPYSDGHYMMWFHTDLWMPDLLKRLKPDS
ncbi:MAG: hypothetical protein GC134_03840 [Proteobacteria bacterium]|nr:hypothetical protein [Pseudomonadota bacterium]